MLKNRKLSRDKICNERDKELYKHNLNLADIVTLFRIVGAVLLIAIKPTSGLFLLLYTITGATDVIDGQIARKTNTSSEFGARLDSIADVYFLGLPHLKLCLYYGVN